MTGDRHWANEIVVRGALGTLPDGSIIYEGGASGLDFLVREVAPEMGHTVITIRARWTDYGRAAGPMRNKEMLERLDWWEDVLEKKVMAFHNKLPQSKGTKDCVKQALKKGLVVELRDNSGRIIPIPNLG